MHSSMKSILQVIISFYIWKTKSQSRDRKECRAESALMIKINKAVHREWNIPQRVKSLRTGGWRLGYFYIYPNSINLKNEENCTRQITQVGKPERVIAPTPRVDLAKILTGTHRLPGEKNAKFPPPPPQTFGDT